MLFNSHVFIFAFLPIVLAGFFMLGRRRSSAAARWWLLAASLVFYGWWSWGYLALLLATMVFNWGLGRLVAHLREHVPGRGRRLTELGVAVNLALLGWFKYATFIAGNVTALTGIDFALEAVVLPLAISFHTFQQIAYLVDVQRGTAKQYALSDYLLFVSFFPQLIAGPIVHHYELLPQFERRETYRFQAEAFAAGVAFFVIGLTKKLAIADPVGALATPTFAGAEVDAPGMVEAWLAAVAYSLGLYFDFSAYSDMAVGLARMFGIRLPYNFNSPYKAASIIDFWRRWHMTLSRFLRDYLYVPLGGSRRGPAAAPPEPDGDHAAGRPVARRGLDLRDLGRPARLLPAGEPRLERLRRPGRGSRPAAALPRGAAGAGPDPSRGPGRLGVLRRAEPRGRAHGPRRNGRGERVRAASPGDRRPRRRRPRAQGGGAAGSGTEGALALLGTVGALAALVGGAFLVLAAPNSQEIVDGRAERIDEPRRWRRIRFRPSPAMAVGAAAAFLFALTLMADVKEFVYFQF